MKPLSKLHTEAIEKAQTEQAKVKAATASKPMCAHRGGVPDIQARVA